jgi:hypothetical protein
MKLSTGLLGVVAVVASCSPCRTVPHRNIAIVCDTAATFEGELHIDSAATLTTFLFSECVSVDEDVAAAVAEIDFSNEGAFFVRGLRNTLSGCVNRIIGDVAVCNDGLRLGFSDEPQGNAGCTGYWESLVAMPRDELRAAVSP